MSLLSFLPDSILLFVINSVLIVGVVGTVVGFALTVIPFVDVYRLQIQIISIVLLTCGVYFKGGYSVEAEWRVKVAKVEAENARLLAQSKTISNTVVTKYVDRIKVIKTKGDEIVKEVPIYITKELDAKCEIPDEFIKLHNAAVENK